MSLYQTNEANTSADGWDTKDVSLPERQSNFFIQISWILGNMNNLKSIWKFINHKSFLLSWFLVYFDFIFCIKLSILNLNSKYSLWSSFLFQFFKIDIIKFKTEDEPRISINQNTIDRLFNQIEKQQATIDKQQDIIDKQQDTIDNLTQIIQNQSRSSFCLVLIIFNFFYHFCLILFYLYVLFFFIFILVSLISHQ